MIPFNNTDPVRIALKFVYLFKLSRHAPQCQSLYPLVPGPELDVFIWARLRRDPQLLQLQSERLHEFKYHIAWLAAWNRLQVF